MSPISGKVKRSPDQRFGAFRFYHGFQQFSLAMLAEELTLVPRDRYGWVPPSLSPISDHSRKVKAKCVAMVCPGSLPSGFEKLLVFRRQGEFECCFLRFDPFA